MKFIIIYFSGTGNTELIGNEIKNRLENKNHSVELVSIENIEDLIKLDFKNKIIGFGYPVYKFSYPDIFNNVMPQINHLAKGNKYFQFSTYARFDAEAFNDFSRKLNKNKYSSIAEKSFKAPSCGISGRKPVEDYEYKCVMFFEDQISKKLDEFSDEICLKTETSLKVNQNKININGLKKMIVKDIEKTKYPKLQINKGKCINCGLCVRKCPESNLINSQNHIDIIDEFNCLHCLRCMNRCPLNAINFGELTLGDNQYTLKIRDELYLKSSDGYHEKYWEEFNKVIKKWKRSTIKYWITHKFRSGRA